MLSFCANFRFISRIQEGDLYLLGPQLPHLFFHQTPPREGARAEVLHLHEHIMNQPIMRSTTLRDMHQLIQRAAGGLCYRGEDAVRIGTYVKKIRTADGPYQWRLFFQLWEELLSLPDPEPISGIGNEFQATPAHCERIERVCHYMIGHFQENISHWDMAAMSHYSPAAFSRSFKRVTRKTFTQFLTELRLRHACTLLGETDWTILRIAMESGFQNLSNFNRRFLATRGENPSRYRKRQSQLISTTTTEATDSIQNKT